jgi:hypothetical protein
VWWRGGTGATTLAVNGVPTMFGADGAFAELLTTRYGLNHACWTSADGAGRNRQALCSFLVAEQYRQRETRLHDDTVALRLNAIGDRRRVRTGRSTASRTVLATAMNSERTRPGDRRVCPPFEDSC